MIVVLKPNVEIKKQEHLAKWFGDMGVRVNIAESCQQVVLGLIGNTSKIDLELVKSLDIVDRIEKVPDSFKRSNRRFHPDDTIVTVGNVKIGGDNFAIIAGPSTVETEEQIVEVAKAVKAAGADMLRGGAFTPMTSPYEFPGLMAEGIELLKIARQETGLPIVTEIMSVTDLPLYEDVDMIQIGAKCMNNYDLLKELGQINKPVILRRGHASTLNELLLSAECIMDSGNTQVILCERGLRTYSDYTKNTLDLAAIPMLKELSHLPVIVDPSRGTGISKLVPAMAMAATASGATGLVIEVNNIDEKSVSENGADLSFAEFEKALVKIKAVREAVK